MDERIAEKQDRPSLIIEDPPPPQGPLNSPKYIFFTFWLMYEKLVCDEGCIC